MKRNPPGLLWLAIVVLGFVALITLFSPSRHSLLVSVVASACDVALLFGLLQGHKWAYFLTLVLSLLGTVVAFAKGPGHGFAMLIGNALVVVPVLFCTPFFFPEEDQKQNP